MIKPKGVKGTYWCDFYTPEGNRVRQSLHTSDKKVAQQAEAKLIADAEDRTKNKARGGLTLKQAFAHALRSRDNWRSAKSLHSIHQIYGMVAAHFKEHTPLAELDDDCLMEYGEELFDCGLTPSTINKRFSLIAVLFYEAIRRDKYHGKKPSIERYKVRNGRKRLITPAEEAQIIATLQGMGSPWELALADLVVVLADTGMRLSEGLGVEPQHIDTDSRTLLIPISKNDEARVVPLTTRALQVLLNRSDCSPTFHPLSRSTASHIWRRVRVKMGLQDEREFVLHSFRHTFGSTLANAGMDAFRIQKVMGHKTIATTQKYIKVSTSALDDVSKIMQDRCTKSMPKSMPKRADIDEASGA